MGVFQLIVLFRLIVFSFSIFSMSACVSIGSNFPTRTDWLHKNETSRQDVRKVLGAPSAVGSSSGVETWTYSYYKYEVWSTPKYKELKLYWSPKGVIKHYNMSSSFPSDIAISEKNARFTKSKQQLKNSKG